MIEPGLIGFYKKKGVKLLTERVKYIAVEALYRYCVDLFKSVGVPEDEALINADNLVDANLKGIDSHGVSRIANYLKRIHQGVVIPKCKMKIITESLSTSAINGCNSLGAVVSSKAMEIAINKARETGTAFVTVNNSNHFGTAAYFSSMALKYDMIGFCTTNGPARMAPWGGRVPFFGTNPFSVSIPAGEELPIIVDMATSIVARGKIILAAKNNENIPQGWAINNMGQYTIDSKEALEGSVLPFGGPKGSAIALLIDILSGILAGAGIGTQIIDIESNFKDSANIGHLFGAISIEKFISIDIFKANVDKLVREIKASPPAQGNSEIFLPGEIEFHKRQERLKEGIPISSAVLEELKIEGLLCGIKIPSDW